jgi:hypothetical protein
MAENTVDTLRIEIEADAKKAKKHMTEKLTIFTANCCWRKKNLY